jgi:hypothetical protein
MTTTRKPKIPVFDHGPTWEIALVENDERAVVRVAKTSPLDADGLRELATAILAAATEIDGRETEISIVVVNGVDA